MYSIVYFNRSMDRYEKYNMHKGQLSSTARVKKKKFLNSIYIRILARDSAEVRRIFISMRIRSALGLKAPKFRTSWKSVLRGKNLRIGLVMSMNYHVRNVSEVMAFN